MSLFNQGPEPKIILNENGVRYIDPNPTDQIVNHEDLVMYVKLVARSKGRSILTRDEEVVIAETEQRNVKSETNFTYPTGKNFLDTSWTNIGGGNIELGGDLGTFGITGIDIEFKSSFMPQIIVNFVDVRGAALFEQGPCSPYSLFFHLPYPVFELTVKGYYGKPVTYTLALVKFNTKFNAETGNFESKGEFVGYTYAFLADLPLGYIMATNYIPRGGEIHTQIWQKVTSRPEFADSYYGLDPNEPMSIFDMIRKSKKLETEVPEFKNTTEVEEVSKLAKVRESLNDLKKEVINYQKEVLNVIGKNNAGISDDGSGNKNSRLYISVPKGESTDNISKFTEVNKKYISDTLDEDGFQHGLINGRLQNVKAFMEISGVNSLPDVNFQNIKANSSGFFNSTLQSNSDGTKDEWYVDTFQSMIKPINESISSVETQYKEKRKEVQKLLNDAVRKTLGFWPSVRNVFVILTTNTEAFLQLLAEVSKEAEEYHETETFTSADKLLELKNLLGAQLADENQTGTNKEKVYPWPTYYETRQKVAGEGGGDPGEKEEYPGEKLEYATWPEVIFVEEFIKALTKLREDQELLDIEDVDNEPGFDNFAPITAFETHAFGEPKAPNRWLNIENGIDKLSDAKESVYCMMGENAFLLGDYSMINSLSVWKSQLGFYNGWGWDVLTNGNSNTNGYTNSADKLQVGPQRLKDNPIVTANISANNQLGRYPNAPTNDKGFQFIKRLMDKDDGDGKEMMFQGKISPTTKERIKRWGKVDAINLLSTLSSDGQQTLLTLLKTDLDGQDKTFLKNKIKEALKKKYSDDFKTQTFDEWKVSATQAIGGTTALIDQQSNIWADYFSYVKTSNVLTLSKPIRLTYNESITDQEISANPHNNPFGGVRLMTVSELDEGGRTINFDEKVINKKILELYTKHYGKSSESSTNEEDDENNAPEDNNLNADTNSLSFTTLRKKPKWTTVGKSALTSISESGVGLNLNKYFNILSYNNTKQFRANFFHNFSEHAENLTKDAGLIWDIGSSRQVYSRELSSSVGYKEWNDFLLHSANNTLGAADAFVQTPLWTLNYPPYKNPYYASYSNIIHDENIGYGGSVGWTAGEGREKKGTNNNVNNFTRNCATWWGLNQYYTDSNSINKNYHLLPLAYLTVMSYGYESAKGHPTQYTGHHIPYDGNQFIESSSFTNFTHTHVAAQPPKSWILLLGSILWRAKEGHLLINEEIEPTFYYKGWNRTETSIWEDDDVIINDLSDPVWFFHNSLSLPYNRGGTVLSINTNHTNTDYFGAGNDWVTPHYLRRFLGWDQNGIGRWTSSGGDANFYNNKFANTECIGSVDPTAFDYQNTSISFNTKLSSGGATTYVKAMNNQKGWLKSHELTGTDAGSGYNKKLRKLTNISRGNFDLCRQDQIPMLDPTSTYYIDADYRTPKTLVLADLSDSRKRSNHMGNTTNTYGSPNLVSNQYLNIKEKMKELMFLPTSFKEELIAYFIKWATDETEAFGKAGWLRTMDPLNWEKDVGLTHYNENYVNEWKDWTVYEGNVTQPGYNGYLDKKYTEKMLNGEINQKSKPTSNATGGGFFEGSDKKFNLWFNTYGGDNNALRTKKPNPPSRYDSANNNPGAGCFPVGTKVLLGDGKYKNIEEITQNDIVLSYDLESKTFDASPIDNITMIYSNELIKIYLENGSTIKSTIYHPYVVKGKGVSKYKINEGLEDVVTNKQLSVGDEIYFYLDGNFKFIKIDKIVELENKPTKVWNLNSVTKNNNFIVNNILVHNKP